MLALLIIGVFGLASLLLAYKSPKRTLYLAVFLAPWQGLDSDIGLRIIAYQVILLSLIVVLFSKSIKINIRYNGVFYLFIFFTLLWSITNSLFLPTPTMGIQGGAMRSPELRSYAQLVVFLLTISPVFIIPAVIRDPKDIIDLGKITIWSAVVLAILGWFQIALWYGIGWNPLPIGLVNSLLTGSDSLREGIDVYAGQYIYRMNALAGEPKGLGQALVMAMLLIQTIYLFSQKLNVKKLKWIWILLCISTLQTLSTSAIYLWLIGTVVIVFLWFIYAKTANFLIKGIMIMSLLLMLTSLLFFNNASFMSGSSDADNSSIGLLKHRTVDRSAIEDFDSVIIDYLIDHPSNLFLGVGLGNIHLYTDAYIPKENLHYMQNSIIVAKSGYLWLVSSIGIIGLLIFAIWIWNEISLLMKLRATINKKKKEIINVLVIFAITALVCYMARIYVTNQFFIALGVVIAARTILKQRSYSVPKKQKSKYITWDIKKYRINKTGIIKQ